MNKRESFILYTSFYKPISKLSDKQLGRLFRAIFAYNLGEVVNVEEDISMAFGFFENQFELDEQKRQDKIMRDIENGRKGGNPNLKKGQPNPYAKKTTQDNPRLSKTTQDKAINENENENENENGNSPPVLPPQLEEKIVFGFRQNIRLSENEMQMLKMKMAESGLDEIYLTRLFDKFSGYKDNAGKSYKSDLSALISWGIPAILEEIKRTQRTASQRQQPTSGRDLIGNDDEFTSD